MKLLTFRDNSNDNGAAGALKLGVSTAAGVIDVGAAGAALGGGAPGTMAELLAGGAAALAALRELVGKAEGQTGPWLRDEASLTLGPSAPNPGKILCVGLNYRKHAEESGAAIPTSPVLFSKFANTIAAPEEAVPLTAVGTEYDYEVELGVVIGKTAKNVAEAEALDCVLGYTTANDVSCRDLQMRTSQWLIGKTQDKFLPIGPYLVTADEAGDPQRFQLRTWHNGVLRQDSSSADQIFPVAEVIAYASQFFPLEPGDVIVTGTPAGVIMGLPEKNWLKPGDEVVVEVEGLGKLRNTFVAG
jgi:2-keto-4-pentenoate hydratase/2-oxohepta-3-ene-1,7-dioic acid hydratase in catechol pathway